MAALLQTIPPALRARTNWGAKARAEILRFASVTSPKAIGSQGPVSGEELLDALTLGDFGSYLGFIGAIKKALLKNSVKPVVEWLAKEAAYHRGKQAFETPLSRNVAFVYSPGDQAVLTWWQVWKAGDKRHSALSFTQITVYGPTGGTPRSQFWLPGAPGLNNLGPWAAYAPRLLTDWCIPGELASC